MNPVVGTEIAAMIWLHLGLPERGDPAVGGACVARRGEACDVERRALMSVWTAAVFEFCPTGFPVLSTPRPDAPGPQIS